MKRAIALLLLAGVAHADTDAHVGYIAGLLDAIRTIDHQTLANTASYIQVTERNKCQAPEQALRVGCLLEAAARNCKQAQGPARERCDRVSDVIVTNRLGEELFVPKDVRYEIMSKVKDYRTEIVRELDRRYAILVAELAMSPHFPGSHADSTQLATSIDAYCHEVAGTRAMSWQYCIGAIVWFVGTDGQTMRPVKP